MSMPTFPEISPEITYDKALNMILASIAMEELALSHVVNAEGEKLQYVLGTLKTSKGKEPTVDEILAVNESIIGVLDSVSQNQMLLKNKMDKALGALSDKCPGPACTCPCKCSGVFQGAEKGKIWCANTSLPWKEKYLHGRCVCLNPCDNTKINLCSKGRFMVSLAVNVKAKASACSKCGIAICLQLLEGQQILDVFTAHESIQHTDTIVTVSISGIVLEAFNHCDPPSVLLKLVSPESLCVERAMLSIVEI